MTWVVVLILVGTGLELMGIGLVASVRAVRLWDLLLGWTKILTKKSATFITRALRRMWSEANILARRIFRLKPEGQVIEASAIGVSLRVPTPQIVRGYNWNNDGYEESIAQLREHIERQQDQIDNMWNRIRESVQQDISLAEERIMTTSPLRRDLDPLMKYLPLRDIGVVFLLAGILCTAVGNVLFFR